MARKAFEAKSHNSEVMGTLPIDSNFIDSLSVRETIESIAIAVILAMIFKTLEAEAYVIPTGSMAPTLMGQHVEIQCEECDYWFRSGTTYEGPGHNQPVKPGNGLVTEVRCPMCHHGQDLNRMPGPNYDANEESFSGDRIVVSKVEYIFRDPKRWDVIVFKYPGNGKQNYIKRLVGLPGETLLLNNGDVFVRSAATETVNNDDPDQRAKLIARKSPDKLAAIMIPVQDSQHFSPTLRAAGMPPAWMPRNAVKPDDGGNDTLNWLEFEATDNPWAVSADSETAATYSIAATETEGQGLHWLRFKNLIPTTFDWETVESGDALPGGLTNSPGSLVSDYYCYSDSNEQTRTLRDELRMGTNWVGDLVLEADVNIESSTGTIALDAVEGGVHFLCRIDIASGEATLQPVISDEDVDVRFSNEQGQFDKTIHKFQTPLKGSGSYQIRYANCDNRVYLWVNGTSVAIPNDGAYSRRGPLQPFYSAADPADAQPLAVGVENASVKVTRLKVFRDLYYNDYAFGTVKPTNLEAPPRQVQELFVNPEIWKEKRFDRWFAGLSAKLDWEKSFSLGEAQFFPLGDNSPNSLDARVWKADHHVDGDMMIGKALMVYWPHTWNTPKYWPNFGRIRVIH